MTEQKESHWLPALRPNDEDMDHATPDLKENGISQIQHPEKPISTAHPSYHDNSRHDPDSTGEDEEVQVDPAWGLKRTESAHILDTIRRSTSFPRPILDQALFSPPPDQGEFFQEQTLEQSSIPKPLSQTQPSFEAEEHYQDQETLQSAQQISDVVEEDQPAIDSPTAPGQEESRFDEGVPLIQESQPEPQFEYELESESASAPVPQSTLSAFDELDAETIEADGFFSQIEPDQSIATAGSPILERKGTDEILDGLGLPSAAPDSPPPATEQQNTSTGNTAKEKDLAAAFAEIDDTEDDPWKAALGDDDDFLVEDADDLLPDSDSESEVAAVPTANQASGQQRAAPTAQRSNSNVYAPHQPSTSELTQFGAATHNVGLPRQVSSPLNAFQPQQPPNITNRAASFVDQSKGGYKSPYDLPMDLAPKRKAQVPRAVPQLNNLPPPPRSSSIGAEKQLQSPFTPTASSYNHQATTSPASAAMPPPATRGVPGRPQPPTKRMSSGFFEELPMAVRTRPPTSSASAVNTTVTGPPRIPSTQTPAPPPQIPTPSSQMLASPPQLSNQGPSPRQDPYAQYQLRQPERLDPYANVASQTTQVSQPPVTNSRYSPAPPSAPGAIKPTPSPRYSPAPPPQADAASNRYVSQPVPPPANLPFLPRTSSPLAQHRKSADKLVDPVAQQRPALQHALSSSVPYAASFSQAAANTLSPPRGMDPTKQQGFIPPQRSQTQSPSRQTVKPAITARIVPPPQRPATALGQLSPTRTSAVPNILSPPRVVPQQRPAEEVEYIRPNDGTEHDPLEKWKGTPIFNFGFGGTVVSSFPKRVPRFSSAATRPQMKVSAGEVTVKKIEEWIPLKDHVSKFPGPLKGKAKKKDVLTWLASSISGFENEAMSFPSKNLEEKILLWKVMRILVEQDGNLDGPQAVQSVSEILMPSVYTVEDVSSSQYRAEDVAPGIYRPASVSARTETVDPVAVESLRKTLLKGKREDAVWQAVDNRLWAHALLLSSTLDKAVWKQVVQEFVKQEVKAIGANAESLCALYEILGGNLEESVDQLVPPSARAGLQMVSKVETSGPTRNALDGLDRWKETLCLVLNNRSNEDQRALVTLARLLSDYGRIEASHVCYLFARNINLPTMFGGADDPNTHIVLLGADHRQRPLSFHQDMDAIMLTEVFEFAVSTLAAGSTGAPMPHLAAYKLQRANELTDAGRKTEAQAYCEAVAFGLKSSTKHSLYYNPILLGEVEDLSNRLKQIPVQSTSWIAKPSIEKASTSVWNKFSSFVTGEDSDAESKGSARDAAESGPFAKVSGSPSLSRNTSQTDLYGSYPAMTPVAAPATSAGSRYAPNGMSSTRSSSDLTRGRMSFESQRSPPSTAHSNEGRSLYAPMAPPQLQSQYSPSAMSPQATGYQPSPGVQMPPVAEEISAAQYQSYMPQVAEPIQNGVSPEPSYGGYQPVEALPQDDQYDQDAVPEPTSTFEPPQSSYGGYEPPEDSGYVPYQPDADSDTEDTKSKPKKKSFLDDDDDNFGPISKPTPPPAVASSNTPDSDAARRKANDEAAEAAFRAAAEADAKAAKDSKSSNKKASGSWLGGWFGGAKKPADSLDAGGSSDSKSSSAQKVHRVHLGESKMKLYYDENKKKWVNPDNPEASEKKAVAPPPRGSTGSAPPPMGGAGGPPRSVSTPHTLPVGGLSRSGTPASVAVDSEGPDSRPGSSHMPPTSGFAATLPPGTTERLGLGGTPTPLPTPPGSSSGPPGSAGSGLGVPSANTGPPSRPASALSNASGLDDLLGAPGGARKVSGRGAKAKKGRYVDVMAK